jgi:hypothetical protein
LGRPLRFALGLLAFGEPAEHGTSAVADRRPKFQEGRPATTATPGGKRADRNAGQPRHGRCVYGFIEPARIILKDILDFGKVVTGIGHALYSSYCE